jgi:hypothetical protein
LNEHTSLYQHTKRPEWGYGAIVEVTADRTTFRFDDGASRAIRHDYIHMMLEVELQDPEASAVRGRIGKIAPSRSGIAVAKSKTKKGAAKKPAALPR